MALTFAAAIVFYWPGVSGPFIFDDIPNITEQSAVHAKEISRDTISEAASAYSSRFSPGRPLATITFAIDHARAGGLDASVFKQTNLVIHAFNTLLVVLLVIQLLKRAQVVHPGGVESATPAPGSKHLMTWAGAITLLWAIHPVQVSTVLYVVQRMEMLAVTFTLMALISYCHGRHRQILGIPRGWPFVIGALILAGFGLLAKETAVLFILFALCLELTLFGFRAERHRTATLIKTGYAVLILAGLMFYLLVIMPIFTSPEAFQHRDFTWYERLITQLRVLPLYLSQVLLPTMDRLPFFYDDYSASSSLFKPLTTLLGGLLLAGLLTLAMVVRRNAPLLALSILWFFAAHALSSNILSLELVFEHRNYFAVLPVILGAACIVALLPRIRIRLSPGVIGTLALILLGTLTLIRSATWGDPLNLAMHHAAIAPKSERARLEIGFVYGSMSGGSPDSPFFTFAREAFKRAAELPNSSPLPEQALIVLAATADVEAENDWWISLNEKLRTRPMSSQVRSAARAIVLARTQSFPVDDDWLAKIYKTLTERPETPAELLMPFASYALRVEMSQLEPKAVLMEVARRAKGNPDQLNQWAMELTHAGYHDQAFILFSQSP